MGDLKPQNTKTQTFAEFLQLPAKFAQKTPHQEKDDDAMTGPGTEAVQDRPINSIMLETTNEHLADIAAGSPPAAMAADEEDVAAAGPTNNEPAPLDTAYIESLKLLAEKKVREAEEKAKMDEEADWFAAADRSRNNYNTDEAAPSTKEGGGNNNTPTTEDILQSIEESVDYNNQTSGFVS